VAETFRKSKIEHYLTALALRRLTLKQQLEREEYAGIRDYLRGQLCAIDLIVNELSSEFAVEPPSPASDKGEETKP